MSVSSLERTRRFHRAHPEKAAEYMSRFKAAHPEANRVYQRRWKSQNADVMRAQRLRKSYGISLTEYAKLLDAQNGLCAICGKRETFKKRDGTVAPLAVDHNHKTSVVRGLLCHRCNIHLGGFEDSRELLVAALRYLEKAGN